MRGHRYLTVGWFEPCRFANRWYRGGSRQIDSLEKIVKVVAKKMIASYLFVSCTCTAPFIGYTVSMLNSTFADMSSIFATGLTQVYTGNHTTNAGTDSLDFNTGTFTWDGVSNVIVEICYGMNAASFPANDQMSGIDDNPIIACDHSFSNSGAGR